MAEPEASPDPSADAHRQSKCPHCGYDLTGRLSELDRCPECGLGDLTRVQLRPGEVLSARAATAEDLETVRQRRLRRLQPARLLQMVMFWACIGAIVGFAAPSISMLITNRRPVITPGLAAGCVGVLAPVVAVTVAYWRAGRRPAASTVVIRRAPPER